MKYGNKKTVYDGITFDSRKEANRYAELKLLERAGRITNLEMQKKYELIPAQYKNGKCIERSCSYYADFVYDLNGETIVEDTKGMRTEVYKIKKKLMLERYGIEVQEI